MNILRLLKKNENGSLTVEASIVLPIFMCVVLTFLIFMKVLYIRNNVQYALDQSANEIATYSYLYSVTGLQSANNASKAELDKNAKLAENQIQDIVGTFNALNADGDSIKASSDAMSTGEFGEIDDIGKVYTDRKEEVNKLISTLKEAGKNPKKEFISIASLLLNNGFEKMKTELSTPIIKYFMSKYLDEGIFKAKGPGVYIYNNGDSTLASLDLSKSTVFKDNKSIDITIRYKIKTALPINFLPEIEMEQKATIRGWLNGDKSSLVESIWGKDPLEYGKLISDMELKNYPQRYPISGDAYEVRSVNVLSAYYKDTANLKKTIKQSIDKFNNMKESKSKIVESKTLILIVPEGTLTDEVKKVMKECEEYAKSLGIALKTKEGYGKAPNKK